MTQGVHSVVVADDHAILRDGLRAVLAAEADVALLGEAADGMHALDLVRTLHPDVLLLDLSMPELDGLDVLRQVFQEQPETRVLVLSMHDSEAWVLESFRLGAAGYIAKRDTSQCVIEAIRTVAGGRRYLSPLLAARAINFYADNMRGTRQDPLSALTNREREVFFLLVDGLHTPELALRLGISARTAEMHRQNLMHKLHARDTADLVHIALTRD